MFRSILVPLDGSTFGEQALPLALTVAARARASLQVVHVHIPLAPMYAESIPNFENTMGPALRRQSCAYLDGVLDRLARVSRVSVTAALLEGNIVEALHEQAAARGADLVVMSRHGRGPLVRAWLGSVADEVVRRLPMPVLLVRPHKETHDLAREVHLQHVLIPLDGSSLAEQVLEPALALGSLLEADFRLLRVIKPMVLGNYEPVDMPLYQLDPSLMQHLLPLHEEERTEAEHYLQQVAERMRLRSARVETQVVIHEQPALAILDEVKAHRVDLVALGTHGRSGLPRLFLGSVADKVLRGAALPVLIQRPAPKEYGP